MRVSEEILICRLFLSYAADYTFNLVAKIPPYSTFFFFVPGVDVCARAAEGNHLNVLQWARQVFFAAFVSTNFYSRVLNRYI